MALFAPTTELAIKMMINDNDRARQQDWDRGGKCVFAMWCEPERGGRAAHRTENR